jgi:hypothetical protein
LIIILRAISKIKVITDFKFKSSTLKLKFLI